VVLRFLLVLAWLLAGCSVGSSGTADGGLGFDGLMDARLDAGLVCDQDIECDDRIACTIDHCEAGSCTHTPCTDCCPDELTCVEGSGCIAGVTLCDTDAECGDGIPCTLDRCRDADRCEHAPEDALCGSGEICLGAVGCIPEPPTTCETDADCDVGIACVASWRCEVEFGCQFVSLLDCDDDDECTVDSCSEAAGGCTHALRDLDMDGHADGACEGGDDCDDDDAAVNPDATETCGDGGDEDCDDLIDEGCCEEGLPCTTSCGTTGAVSCAGGSGTCVPPAETCNDMDDDCDTDVDETFPCRVGTSTSCTTSCGSNGTRACLPGCTYDTTCAPPAETCNGVDDNCNSSCDETFTCCAGATTPCTTLGFVSGTATCRSSCASWNTSACSNCGNGTINAGESCDGSALGGATCTSIGMGFNGGTLRCGTDCDYDTATCTRCGDGTRNGPEQCDGSDLAGQSCASRGFTGGGTLRCSSSCAFDTSMCIWSPTGTYVVTPQVNFVCAIGLVAFNFSSLTFTDTGSALSVAPPAPGFGCTMTGASARVTRMFDVSCTVPGGAGGCDETYRLVGSFTDDDTWTGTFTASFSGSCLDCTFTTFSGRTGSR
jgi:hypothetical protein